MHWIHTSFQGRWGQASPRIVDDIFLRLFFLLLLFYLSIFFALSFLTIHDSTLPSCIFCVQTAAVATAGFSSVYYYILFRLSLFCTLHPIYTIRRLFFPSSSLVFSKKKLILTDCFFCGTFLCVYVSLFRLLLLLQLSCSDYNMYIYIYMCVCMKRRTRRETWWWWKTKRRKNRNWELHFYYDYGLLLLLFLRLLAKCKSILTIGMFLSQIDYWTLEFLFTLLMY